MEDVSLPSSETWSLFSPSVCRWIASNMHARRNMDVHVENGSSKTKRKEKKRKVFEAGGVGRSKEKGCPEREGEGEGETGRREKGK